MTVSLPDPAPEPALLGAGAHDHDSQGLTALVLAKLDADKAEDVVAIDLKGQSSLADAIIVASGRSHRHVAAMADHLVRALKEAGYGRAGVEGLPHADWVLIDAGDVIVHLFRPEVRAFYQLEKIWSVDSPHRTPRPPAASAYDDLDASGDLDEDDDPNAEPIEETVGDEGDHAASGEA